MLTRPLSYIKEEDEPRNKQRLRIIYYNLKNREVISVLDPTVGFRVIIVVEANSYVSIRSSRLLPKFKTQKINSVVLLRASNLIMRM